jgi:L-prolyl-[peptidyl-carrier protein] dehydrogenase
VHFDRTPSQHALYDEILTRTRAELGAPAGDRPEDHFDRDRWSQVGSLGLLGLCLPVEHGGRGLGALDTAIALEAFGEGCPDTGLVFAVSAHLLACAVPIRDFAAPATRARLLPGLASGELLAANAMTESGAGSDVSGLAVTAVRSGDGYRLDGEKSFASNAPLADVFVTYGVTDPDAGFLGINGFAVERGPGVETSAPFAKMGLTSCPAGRVRFAGCEVPASARLGEDGQGAGIFQHSMAWERAVLFAGYLGLMRRQLTACVAHARGRKQFGRALSDFQAVSHRIAGMTHRLESARLLLYRACWRLDQGRPDAVETALAKVAVSEAAVANSLDAVQVFGGRGYLRPDGIETMLRDSVPSLLFSGTNDIQRELIAQGVGL